MAKTKSTKKPKYPGIEQAEKQKSVKTLFAEEKPDFIGNAPNYEKFNGWNAEKVLAWLNID